ncbi:MAG: DUF5655 domain-containing protein [Anaerolineales bacterium]
MAKTPEDALQTLIGNLPEKTGKSLEQWFALIKSKKLTKHGDIMKLVKGEHGVSHGFANSIAILYNRQSAGAPSNDEEIVAAQYAGPKAGMKPLYNEIVKAVKGFGKDVVISPKKANVSLRRNKQFGLIQPTTKDRIDLGLILRDVPTKGRLEEGSTFSGMCTHRVRLTSKADLDKEVLNWLRQAYEQA